MTPIGAPDVEPSDVDTDGWKVNILCGFTVRPVPSRSTKRDTSTQYIGPDAAAMFLKSALIALFIVLWTRRSLSATLSPHHEPGSS